LFVYAVHLNDRMEWVATFATEEHARAALVEFLSKKFGVDSQMSDTNMFSEKFDMMDEFGDYLLSSYIGATE
jgi:hypothetical protein